ncbi:MAG: acyltransferase [Candidatus Electrothrix sp. AR3]|nr:acyltransferase [Candidatus Electrothrix sp. AR3]
MNNIPEANTTINVLAGIIAVCVCTLTAKGLTHLQFNRVKSSVFKDRLGCIDGLRGLLALGVFLHHYVITYHFHLTGKWTVPPSAFYTLTGQVSVAFFFMVTGFLFWNKILASQGKIHWLQLYVSRIFRLVPLYWFVVTVISILVLCIGGNTLRVSLLSLAKSIVMWLSFLETPDINAFAKTHLMVASVTWTLKYEWFFYLSLPILSILLKADRKNKVFIWIFAVFIAWISILEMPISLVYLNINTKFFIYFLVGAVSASMSTVDTYRARAQSKLASYLSIGCLLVLFMFFRNSYGEWQLLLMAIFFLCVSLGNSLFGILELPSLVLLGEISYSVYLLHGLLLYISFSIVFPSFMHANTSLFYVSLGMSIVGSLLVVFSWLTFSLLEMPFIEIGKKLRRTL